ncbi:MAG TPA: MFS transporter [Syntrophomonadaceae bacterium]|nr:MFS transporter [Syntrophomonadaceae bacterium]
MKNLLRGAAPPLILFAAAQLMMGMYSGFYDPSFNNYLSQIYHLSAVARGSLEFTRELPGFLMVFVFALLAFLPDSRIAMLASLLVGISLWGQGHMAPDMAWVVFWMLIWSTGAHLFMVLKSSIGLRLAEKNQEGRLLGRLGALESLGILIGMLFLYLGVHFFHISFAVIFGFSGTCALAAALLLYLIKPQPIQKGTRRLMLKKRYSLFYFLNIVFGARKQVFLTFAPWVLIKVFNCGVDTFALLGICGTVLSLLFRPLLGRAIDAWGEKKILFLESLTLIIICILYGGAAHWLPTKYALVAVMSCYVIDQLLIAVTIARTTYLSRIADSPDDIGPALSMGLTLDHAVSMTVPVGGGLIWAQFGFQWVFWIAALVALANLIASLFMQPKNYQAVDRSEDQGMQKARD